MRVHVKHVQSGSSDRRTALDDAVLDVEMLLPGVSAGIEEPDKIEAYGIDSSKVGALVEVAEETNVMHTKQVGVDPLPAIR